jgi:hypothetical protein
VHKPTTRALESIGQTDEPAHRKSARTRALPDVVDVDLQVLPANKTRHLGCAAAQGDCARR